MFSYVFMKILEGRPASYDKRMDQASGGRVKAAKKAVARLVPDNSRVLEVGCGTGELALMLVEKGCRVHGFDASPAMARLARFRAFEKDLEESLDVRHMGVEGMDGYGDDAFDAVVSTLVFSELSDDERHWAFEQAFRVLAPGGVMVLADEASPPRGMRQAIHAAVRAPQAAAAALFTGRTTRPLADPAGEMKRAGFSVAGEVRSHGGAFVVLAGKKPEA